MKICVLLTPDRLYIREFADAKGAQFAPVSGPLHATEGQPRVGCYHAIDEHHSGFDFVDQALPFFFVIGPGACAQAEAAVIGDENRLIQISRAKYAGYRAK